MSVQLPPRSRRWRVLRPESVAVKWAVVLATVVGGLAAAVPLGLTAVHWWNDRAQDTSITAGATIEQGSAAADALVTQLFDAAAGGRRLELDAVLVAAPSQSNGRATNGFTVFYNCADDSGEPGADRCGRAQLYWESNPLPFPVRNGAGWHLVGTYSIVLDPSQGQVYDAATVAFHLSSVAG